MDVKEAVETRRSVRDFLDTPVDPALLNQILETAIRAPSGGNLQPWYIDVVSGERLQSLKTLMAERIQQADYSEPGEYQIYPSPLKSPYRDRRFQIGETLYAALDIPRENKIERKRWFARNFGFFGAPVALFFSLDKSMGRPQWSDLGMLMQTIMLLLRAEGLDSCAQECWSVYPHTIREFLNYPDERMLFSGMAVGYANESHPVNQFRSERASLSDVVKYHC